MTTLRQVSLITVFLLSVTVVGRSTPLAGAIPPPFIPACSNLLSLVPEAPDPCLSLLTFPEYLGLLKVSGCSIESGCSLRTNENEMIGYWDDLFLKEVSSAAKSFSVWRKSILDFHSRLNFGTNSEMAQPIRLGKLVRRGLPHIIVAEKLSNGWGLPREDITPKSVLDALPVSPASTSNSPKKYLTSSIQLLGSSQRPRSDTGEKNTFQHSFTETNDFARHARLQSDKNDEAADYMMGPSRGRIIRTSDPSAASQNRAIFHLIPDPFAKLQRTAKSKNRRVRVQAPTFPSFSAERLEEKFDALLARPLAQLQRLLDAQMRADRDVSLLREDAAQVKSLINQLVVILDEATLTKYHRIKQVVLAYHESYVEGCRLLEEVAEAWTGMADSLDGLGEEVELEKFDVTLRLLEVIKDDVLISGSKKMTFELSSSLGESQTFVDLASHSKDAPPPPYDSTFPLHPPPLNSPPASTPISHMEALLSPPESPQRSKSIENTLENFLNTIENLKKSLEALKKDTTSLEHLWEQQDALEKELQDLGRHLRESATAKVWSRLLAEENMQHEPVKLETVIQDMLATNHFIRTFKRVYVGRKQTYARQDQTFHDIAWHVSSGLGAALKQASGSQQARLTALLDAGPTLHIVFASRASRASIKGLLNLFAHVHPDALPWFLLQARALASIVNLDAAHWSPAQVAAHLKNQLAKLLDPPLSIADMPYAQFLNEHLRTYLNKLTLLENKLGAESLASVHPDVHDSLRDHFEWEVEQVVGEIVWLKKAIHDLAPSDAMIIPTTTHVPTTKLSKRDASNLGQDKENTKLQAYLKEIEEKLLAGSSIRFERAALLEPLSGGKGMLQLSQDFGRAEAAAEFVRYRGAIDDLIGMLTSIELSKLASCPQAGSSSPVLSAFANHLWTIHGPQKQQVLTLAQSSPPFALILQDIIVHLMAPQVIPNPQIHTSFTLFESYQQSIQLNQEGS